MRASPEPLRRAEMPAPLRHALNACASGALPANVALMHVLACCGSADQARDAAESYLDTLRTAGDDDGAERVTRLLALDRGHPGAHQVVQRVLGTIDHTARAAPPGETIARCAAAFDRAGETAPEAAVALYAFGDPGLLAAATEEIVALLRAWDLLGPDCDLLDIGCGTGRMVRAVAPHVRYIVGTDISASMLSHARQSCRRLGNTAVVRSTGLDLGAFRDETFDTVCAVDVFPYIVQAGVALAARHISEAARVLRPGGALVIMNYSYRGDAAADAVDLARLAADAGFGVVRAGLRPFRLWDGVAFHLQRAG